MTEHLTSKPLLTRSYGQTGGLGLGISATYDCKETITITRWERLNGEIRDREKTMRSLKKVDTPILKGMQIFHNYIREHQGLKDKKTPAEKCGIEIQGENKWLTLIQNACVDRVKN